MSKDITITLSKNMELFLSKRSKKKKILLKDTIEELINEQMNNKIHFDEGFYFDKLKKVKHNEYRERSKSLDKEEVQRHADR